MKHRIGQYSPAWLVPAFVLAVTAAVFFPTLSFEFVCDDKTQIVLNQTRFTWHSILSYFTTDVWSYITLFKTNYYRPVFLSWLMLNYQSFGLNTMLWHAVAIVAHLAATLLVYMLALRLTGRWSIAGTAALLFGIHPVHVETVAWVSGSTETVLAVLGLGCILCHLRWRDSLSSNQRSGWRAAELTLFTLAIFAKETALVLPLILFGWEWLFPEFPFAGGYKKRFRRAMPAVFPYLYIVLFYAFARHHALGSFVPLSRNWTVATLLGTWPMGLFFYLRQLLVPFQYSLFYSIAPVKHFGLHEGVFHLLPVLATIAMLVWLSSRSRVAAFCVLLLALPLAPVLDLKAFAFDDFLHDRYLYLPSAGFCILLALGIEWAIPQIRIRAAVLAALAVFLGLTTVRASQFWKDDLSLYSHAAEIAPDSTIAAEYLGEELIEENRWADALPVLSKALLQDPNSYDMYVRIAKCYLGLGETSEAISYFNDAITLFPDIPGAYLDLATVEFNNNRLSEAENHMRRALQLRPRYSPLYDNYHYRMGRILEGEGKWQEALKEYEAELQESPSYEDAVERRDRIQRRVSANPQ